MTIERINPPGLANAPGVTHVSVARGSRMVFVNGQVAKDADGRLVGAGDHAAQARQAFGNLKCALAAAGATGRDVVQYRLSVVDFSPALLESILAAGTNIFFRQPD